MKYRPRESNLFHIYKLFKSCFTYFVKFQIGSVGQCLSKYLRIISLGPISYIRNLLSLCCRDRRTERSALEKQMARGTEEEIEATGSAGTSKMINYHSPITYNLVPIDNQVTYYFRTGCFF